MSQTLDLRRPISWRGRILVSLFALLILTVAWTPRESPASTPTPAPKSERRMVRGATARVRAFLKNSQPHTRLLIMQGTFIPHKGRLDLIGFGDGTIEEIKPYEYGLMGDSTLRIVNKNDNSIRDVAPFSIGSLVDMIRVIDGGGQVSNPKLVWDSLPPETVNGILCRHYKFDIEYGLPGRGADPAAPVPITRVKGDYWLADLPINFYNPFAGLTRPKGAFTGEQATAIATLYKALRTLTVGTVIKFEARGVIGEGNMNPLIYTRTVNVQDYKVTEVDASLLEPPPNVRDMNPARRGGPPTDSAGRGRGRGTDTTDGRGRARGDTTSR
jgi:hypothetical protein